MTKPAVDEDAFRTWHYKNDLTHVCFFSPPTFTWLARQWNAELTFAGNDVVLFQKNAPEQYLEAFVARQGLLNAELGLRISE
jgi:hypothetical protein